MIAITKNGSVIYVNAATLDKHLALGWSRVVDPNVFATQDEVNAGVVPDKAISPETLSAALAAYVPDPGYLEYVAILTQTGTSAPVATVLVNTLGGVPVWSRQSAGSYRLTLSGAFPATKTICLTNAPTYMGMSVGLAVGDYIELVVFDTTSGTGYDDSLALGTCITIRVYP